MIDARTALLRLPLLLLCGLAAPLGTPAALAADEAAADEAADGGTVYTLTPEDKAAIEAEGDRRAFLGLSGLAPGDGERRIRGEASMMVGTGGARGVATSVIAPVGKSATVGASVLYERNMNRYDPYYAPYGYGPYGYGPYGYGYAPSRYSDWRGSFGGSDYFGHLDRVERMERWQDR